MGFARYISSLIARQSILHTAISTISGSPKTASPPTSFTPTLQGLAQDNPSKKFSFPSAKAKRSQGIPTNLQVASPCPNPSPRPSVCIEVEHYFLLLPTQQPTQRHASSPPCRFRKRPKHDRSPSFQSESDSSQSTVRWTYSSSAIPSRKREVTGRFPGSDGHPSSAVSK